MAKEADKIISSLSPIERNILPFLNNNSVEAIAKEAKTDDTTVRRALQFLSNKNIVKLSGKESKAVILGENGKRYLSEGLPEKKLLELIIKNKSMNLNDARAKSGLSDEEFSVALGTLKKKALIAMAGIKIESKASKDDLEKKSLEEKFLEKLPLDLSKLAPEDRHALDNLKPRKDIVKIEETKKISFELTSLGKELIKNIGKIKNANFIEELTPEMLKSGAWQGKQFRKYDIKSKVPEIYGGKKQPYSSFLDKVRERFMALGFEEMFGPIVESDFWDMDALFMPQFHSARDIHEAYYIKEPKYGQLNEKIVQKVKQAHEKGIAGSKGWGYNFDTQQTHRLMLRTHGTALSARKLASKDLKIPGKYFAISRCFRYDVIDATHLPDFNQVEGIVVAKGLTFEHLKGLLRMFAKEFAKTEQIKIVPAYFPFTEPSCELHAKHPELGWIELGGAGIFRPEVCASLGVDVPVIAWGLGIDRIAMFNLGIKDIRQLFSHDLKFLRSEK